MLVHLLKIYGWPDHSGCRHWRSELVAFQTELKDHFAPSMRQRIDLTTLYLRSLLQVEPLAYTTINLPGHGPRPAHSVWTIC